MKSNNILNKASSKKRTSFIKIFTFICFSFLSLTLIFGLNFKTRYIEYSSATFDSGSSILSVVIDEFSCTVAKGNTFTETISSADFKAKFENYDNSLTYNLLYYKVGASAYVFPIASSSSDYSYYNAYAKVICCLTWNNGLYFEIDNSLNSAFATTINCSSFTLYYEVSSGGYSEEDLNNSYNNGYMAGQISVDIKADNNQAIQDYIADNNYHTDEEYNQYGESQYQAGQDSVDITTDNNQAIQDYITDNNYHTDEDYNQYGENQYQAGQNSVDITTDNNQAIQDYIANNDYHTDTEYNQYGQNQYNIGYIAGQESVDITVDNNQAIEDYIEENNYHTDTEYNQYGESQYQAGQESVDITADNNQAIEDYIEENNYHTDTEYNQYGQNQYNTGYIAGQESVDITTDNQQAIDDFILSTAFECDESYDKFQLSTQVVSYSITLPENLFELVSVNFTLISYYPSGSFLYNDTFNFSVNSFPYVVIGSQNAEYCRISLSDNVLLFEFITPSNTNGFYCYIDSLNVVYTCLGYTQEQYDLNYNNGYELGNSEGYLTGFDSGYDTGYSTGYVLGENDALNGTQTFKGLIYSIIDAPFNVIGSAFDFDVFGVNIASFLMLIVSLLLVAFVLRRLL